MKYVTVMCLNAGLALAAWGQTPAAVTVVMGALSGGAPEMVIQNHYKSSITAYAYSTTFQMGPHLVNGEFFRDSLILAAVYPIGPNGQTARAIGGPNRSNVQCQFRAALFADGSSYGDPAWVQRIQQRRQYAAQALGASLNDLANTSGKPAAGVISQLQAQRNLQVSTASAPDQKMVVQQYYNLMIHSIQKSCPQTSVPPPQAVINSVTGSLRRMLANLGN